MMTIRRYFLSSGFLFIALWGCSQSDSVATSGTDYQLELKQNTDSLTIASAPEQKFKYRESKRLVASVLCLALGPFGMHRLYLGTTPQVAAAYSITLGGIGVLPVVDFFLITFSKDYSRFKNNPKVIMWGQ